MAIEVAAWGIAHDRGCPGYLAAIAIKHAPLHPRHWGVVPIESIGVEHRPLTEVCMELHNADSGP
jgi:hypothetical protein